MKLCQQIYRPPRNRSDIPWNTGLDWSVPTPCSGSNSYGYEEDVVDVIPAGYCSPRPFTSASKSRSAVTHQQQHRPSDPDTSRMYMLLFGHGGGSTMTDTGIECLLDFPSSSGIYDNKPELVSDIISIFIGQV